MGSYTAIEERIQHDYPNDHASMEEADHLCNRVAFMSRGKLVASGTPQEIKRLHNKPGSTLEDAFIHYTSETLSEGSNFGNISRERKTAKRLG